jgi:hypothetical protein
MQELTADSRRTLASRLEKAWSGLLYVLPAAVVAFALYTVYSARTNSAAVSDTMANEIVDHTARAVDQYVWHLSNELRAIGAIPELARLTAKGASATNTAPAEVAQMRDYLSQVVGAKGGAMRELIVADREGDLVVASGSTEDLDQRDETWWQEGLQLPSACDVAHPRTCAYGDDVTHDRSVGGRGAVLAVPIFIDGVAAGVLKAVIDLSEMEALLTLAAAKHPIDVRLIRRDQTNVLTEKAKADRATPSQLARLEPRQDTTIDLDGRRFKARSLAGSHGHLWAVAVGDRAELRANSRQLVALAVVVLVMFLVSARAYALLFHRTA